MKTSRTIVALLAASALLFPAVAPAQTTADLNTQLISTLQQLIVVLENELQQLIAAHRTSPTPPSPNPAPVSPNTGSPIGGDGSLPLQNSSGSCTFIGTTYQNGGTLGCTENPSGGACPLGVPVSSWTCNNGQWVASGGNGGGTNNSFSATPTSGAAPLNVTFSGSVAGTGFSINFGDGSVSPLSACAGGCPSSVAVNITHTYTSAGFYTVLLSNSSGATVGVETILVNAPPAPFGSPTSTTSGGSCIASTTTYQNGTTIWYIGKPAPGVGEVLGQTASQWTCSNGQWVVSGGNGGPQQAGFSASPTSGVAPLSVTFTGVGTGITFGDGTGQAGSDGITLNQVTYTYASPGTYVATSGGSSVTITVTSNSNPPPASCPFYTFPACNGGTYVPQQFQSNGCSIPAHYLCSTGNGLSASPTSGVAPLTVTFTGVGTGINFGDGTGQAGSDGLIVSQASHTYTTAGTYTATNGGSLVTITVTAAVPNPSSCNSTSAPPIGGAACRAGNY